MRLGAGLSSLPHPYETAKGDIVIGVPPSRQMNGAAARTDQAFRGEQADLVEGAIIHDPVTGAAHLNLLPKADAMRIDDRGAAVNRAGHVTPISSQRNRTCSRCTLEEHLGLVAT